MRARARMDREAPGAALAGVPRTLDVTLRIESLDAEGRGVARNAEGKVTFVEGALPGETVAGEVLRKRSSFDLARTVSILEPSAGRRPPECRYFGVCGGCSLQHADMRTELARREE